MKKNIIKTTSANTANTARKNPAEMNIAELIELKKSAKGLMIPIIEALISEKLKLEELQAKVKTSAKRENKVPTAYDLLQPLFVALRGAVNKNIVTNTVIIKMLSDIYASLGMVTDIEIQKRLYLRTVQHNSVSNIAKADSKASAEGRKLAYLEMTEQAKVVLPLPEAKFWSDCLAEYDSAYNKALSKLKK